FALRTQAVPIQMSPIIQMTVRTGTGTKRARHNGALRDPPREQTCTRAAEPILRVLQDMIGHLTTQPAQQEAAPVSPERSAWIGGHGTEPYEQNTQQSPCFGRSIVPQPVHL